jgi:uncharacterized YccA/Bax inhibitor family protein
VEDRSGNPALSNGVLGRVKDVESTQTATISGTSFKILILLALSIGSGFFGWQLMASSSAVSFVPLIGFSLLALVFALATAFKPTWSPFTAPLYALAQGFVMGAISQIYNAQLDGIVVQAIGLTGAIFFVSLWAFWLGLIKVTERFRVGVIIATLGVGLYYLVALVLGLFGITVPLIYDSGPFGIIFSLVIIFIATLNLMLDFDLIKRAEQQKMPKVFEWYGAFALIVTLIWLYLEVLRLLSKTRG